MRYLDFKPNFKLDMSNIEIQGIENILDKLGETYDFLEGMYSDDYGLIYSSTSSYAMLGVNEKIGFGTDEREELLISHFAITENNMLVMVAEDKDENYYYYEIENTDF